MRIILPQTEQTEMFRLTAKHSVAEHLCGHSLNERKYLLTGSVVDKDNAPTLARSRCRLNLMPTPNNNCDSSLSTNPSPLESRKSR